MPSPTTTPWSCSSSAGGTSHAAGEHPRTPAGAARGLLDRSDQITQPGVAGAARPGRPAGPLVAARAPDTQRVAGPPDPDAVDAQLREQAEADSCGHHLLHRRGGPAQDRDLFLQVADALLRPGQLGACPAAGAIDLAAVDEVLPAPAVQLPHAARGRYPLDCATPREAATSLTVRPAASSASAWWRKAGGYDLGMGDPPGCPSGHRLSTRESGEVSHDHGVRTSGSSSLPLSSDRGKRASSSTPATRRIEPTTR